MPRLPRYRRFGYRESRRKGIAPALVDRDWQALAAAGWEVDRNLGKAVKTFPTAEDACVEWETLTGFCGCGLCGQPIRLEDEEGDE